MKKKLLFALAIALIATLVIAIPVLAFSGISFLVYDAVTLDPWGDSAGQSYRIYVWGSSSGELLDTGIITTDGDGDPPSLDFVCSYDSNCPPSATSYLTAPVTGETVTVYIILDGTVDDPSTIIKSYQQPPVDLGNYVISENSGSGPNAVTLKEANAQPPDRWLLVALAAGALVAVGGGLLLLRRRQFVRV